MGSNTKFEVPVKFEAEEVFTFGITNGKYGGYDVPLKFDPESKQLALLKSTAEDSGAALKLYGEDSSTIYLSCDQLTEKQTDELLAKGLMIIGVSFEATGTYKKRDGSIGLRLKVTGLRKVKKAERPKAPPPSD